ncbi:MAG: nucleotidyl transferase AbiEii/AbiGii toxin family protein [Candidatus Omnitrophota bacterium]
MNPQFRAIWEVHRFFAAEKIPYVLIGGIALQWWGEPRFTRDVDVTILVNLGEEETVIRKILSAFSPRIPDALKFCLKNRICLVKSKEGYEIDISLGIPGYEEEAMKRAVKCKLDKGHTVRICSAEDLIIHKAVVGRPRDLSDIESIIIRQGKKLDIRYIRKWLKEFSRALGMHEMLDRFEEVRKQSRRKSD